MSRSVDPLILLDRSIKAAASAPAYALPPLIDRLHRQTAPVLEEREKLLDFMPKGWTWLDNHPNHPDYAEREATLIARIKRYQQIEDVLASFPGSDGSPCGYGSSGASSAKPPIKRSVTSLAQPP